LQPEEYTLFLDENLHNCRAILDALEQAGIPYKRHGEDFKPGTRDTDWLPVVGASRWLLVTVDKNIRYNELERRALHQFRVRAFVFTSGNLGGNTMASLLVKAFPAMTRLCKRQPAPFVASITRSGKVHLRYPRP
jgi:hypothetical protein